MTGVQAGLCAVDAHPLCVQTAACRHRKTNSGAPPWDLTRILQGEDPSGKSVTFWAPTVCHWADPSLQAAQLQLKRVCLAGDWNKPVSHRPAPIFRHILPLPSRTQPAIKEMQLPKVSDESCDDDSSCSLSPGPSINAEYPPGLLSLPSLPQVLAGSSGAPPAMVKKLKYHEYVHPDQKRDKEFPVHLNQSSGGRLHRQQLLQQFKHQQRHAYNYPAILPTRTKPQTGCNSSSYPLSVTSPLVPQPSRAPSLAPSVLFQSSVPLVLGKSANLLPNLDDMRVVELKSELKQRGLTVSGSKNELVERLRSYQELKKGCGNTSSLTAGGTTGSRAERGALTTDGSPPEAPDQTLHHQASLNLRPAAAQPLALLNSDVSPQASSLSTSPGSRNPEDTSVNILEDVDHQLCATSQPRINTKEELRPFTLTPCHLSLRKRKHCQQSWPSSSSSSSAAPGVTEDKDKMLQEKDKQIKRLTRKLMQKEQLVEMLRMQLEIRTHGGARVHVKVKQEPPESCSSAPSHIHLPSPPFPPAAEMVGINQEAIKEEEVVSWTFPGLLPCSREEHTCRVSRQQMTAQRLRLRECEVQKGEWGPQHRGSMLGNLQSHSSQREKSSDTLQLKQEVPRLNHGLTEQQQRPAHLGQQQQRLDAPQETPQVYQICLYPLEVLKNKPIPTMVTGGNDFLIGLGGHHSTNNMPENDATAEIMLQRLQSPAGLHGNNLAELKQKAAEHEGDRVEVVLQSGEWAASKTATDHLDYLNPASPCAAPSSSPLQQNLSPLTLPCLCLTPRISERQTRADAKERGRCPGGCLEDFLKSTVGETLLGAESDGLLSLIDDLHSQMFAPPSSRVESNAESEEEHELDLTVEGVRCDSTLGPMVPPLSSSVFSTDFLDSFDLQTLTV